MIQEKRRKRSLAALALCVVAFVLFSSNEQDESSFSPFSLLRNTSTRFLSHTKKSTNDYLVVINAVAKINNLPLVEHNRRHIFKKDSWDCVIFSVATDELIPESNDYIQKLQNELECSIIRKPGSHWGDFLMFVLPSFVSNYEYVTILLDDIYFPSEGKMALQPDKVIEKMKELNLGSMQPLIKGDTYNIPQSARWFKAIDCIFEAKMLELYAQFFSREAWECYYKMLDYEGSKGWCYDLCMPQECPDVKMAYDGRFLGYHMDREVESMPDDEFIESGDVVITDDVKDWAPQEKVQYAKSNYQHTDGFRMCDKLECSYHWADGIVPDPNILQCPDDEKTEKR
ncbi:hypothetical protein CTEN210_12032 [Chaetoceros tenuissimus]|uniref:Hexosyltransferase n=1 Tax=Chaetoceros tenuissimus TaxID=426638 RepID=A0AAD3D0F8_9STRA|nr:hypothetical protein CTEN210_12032 [Chaetoceros tenuissimus]